MSESVFLQPTFTEINTSSFSSDNISFQDKSGSFSTTFGSTQVILYSGNNSSGDYSLVVSPTTDIVNSLIPIGTTIIYYS